MILLIGIIILLILGLLLALMCLSFNKVIFAPLSNHVWEPTIPHDKIMIENTISAWHFSSFPDSKTVLYCHGNYGNISHKNYLVELCAKQHLNLLLFDYRGYGLSKGVPTQEGLYQDGQMAYHYLAERVHPDNIIIWGESLGGAVATWIASRYPCSSLILLSTFSSLDDIIADRNYQYPVVGPCIIGVARILTLFTDPMSNKKRVSQIRCPIVVIHSREDDLIPFSNAERVYNAIPHNCKKLIEIKGNHSHPEITTEILADIFTFCCIDPTHCPAASPILKRIRQRSVDRLKQRSSSIF